MNQEYFPTRNIYNYPIRDNICHSLIEAILMKKVSYRYIISMLKFLTKYQKEKGNDFIIESLFIKYAKMCKNQIGYYKQNYQNIGNLKYQSQFNIAFSIVCCLTEFNSYESTLISQSWKIYTNDEIEINHVKISNCLAFHLLQYLDYFSDEWILNENKFTMNQEVNELFKDYDQKVTDIKNTDHFISINSLDSFISNNQIDDDITLEIGDNPFLFNVAVMMKYLKIIKDVNYNIENFRFPETITYDIAKLINKKHELKELLEFKTLSIEVKNLCTLISLLIMKEESKENIVLMKNSMAPKSFMILLLIYSNYINTIDTDFQCEEIAHNIYIHNPNDFILVSIFYQKAAKNITNNYFGLSSEYLYMIPRGLIDDNIFSLEISIPLYSIAKLDIDNTQSYNAQKDELIRKYKDDFRLFLNSFFKSCFIEKKIKLIKKYPSMVSFNEINSVFFYLKKKKDIKTIYSFLYSISQLKDYLAFIRQNSNLLNDFKKFLIKIQFLRSTPWYFLKETNFLELFDANEKIELFYNHKYIKTLEFSINRSNLLNDSIEFFKKNSMMNKQINIHYINEQGIDGGGLKRDWFTCVSEEIIKSGVFIPVPNKTSLIFNLKDFNYQLIEFTGKLIGLSLLNKVQIPIKLSPIICKQLLNEEITIEDMKDYDIEIYQSLKWISENEPEELMMNFVNSNGKPLCPNGNEIKLEESNKSEYIKLIVNDMLINKYKNSMKALKHGFMNVVYYKQARIFLTSNDIQEFAFGDEMIDVENWTKLVRNSSNETQEFFDIISHWSQDKIKKLLKFITGVPFVQIYDDKDRIPFIIEFENNSNRLPTAHTCNKLLVLPKYKDRNIMEKNLMLAIECQNFELS